MRRCFLMRRQVVYLLHCIRFFYGAILFNLVIVAFCHHQSVLARVVSLSGIWGKCLILAMAGSALLLMVETLAIWLCDAINSKRIKHLYERNFFFLRYMQAVRSYINTVCVWINRRRQWFYLPPALASLFVIPMSYWLGITEASPIRWFYLGLCLAGIGFAIMEGLVCNNKARYA